MGLFRKAFLNWAAVRKSEAQPYNQETIKIKYEKKLEHLTADQIKRTPGNRERFNPVPPIPSDNSFEKDMSSAKRWSSPFVVLGMGVTTAALLGMFRASFMGDELCAQKFMQYRIMAKFFTLTQSSWALLFSAARTAKKTSKSSEDSKWRLVKSQSRRAFWFSHRDRFMRFLTGCSMSSSTHYKTKSQVFGACWLGLLEQLRLCFYPEHKKALYV